MHRLTVLYCKRQRSKALTTFFLFLLSYSYMFPLMFQKASYEQGRFLLYKSGGTKMIYKRCPHCGQRYEAGKKCGCNFKRDYPQPTGTRALYKAGRWQGLRKVIIARYQGLDPWAFLHGRIEYATTVHHIVTAEDDPTLFYVEDNLIPLSRSSHDEIHALYRKSEASKVETQALLRSLVKKIAY